MTSHSTEFRIQISSLFLVFLRRKTESLRTRIFFAASGWALVILGVSTKPCLIGFAEVLSHEIREHPKTLGLVSEIFQPTTCFKLICPLIVAPLSERESPTLVRSKILHRNLRGSHGTEDVRVAQVKRRARWQFLGCLSLLLCVA